jgi:hypothetical protein
MHDRDTFAQGLKRGDVRRAIGCSRRIASPGRGEDPAAILAAAPAPHPQIDNLVEIEEAWQNVVAEVRVEGRFGPTGLEVEDAEESAIEQESTLDESGDGPTEPRARGGAILAGRAWAGQLSARALRPLHYLHKRASVR